MNWKDLEGKGRGLIEELSRLRKETKTSDQESRSLGWDSNRVPPEYKCILHQVTGLKELSCDVFDIPRINFSSHVHLLKLRTYFGRSSSNCYLKQCGHNQFSIEKWWLLSSSYTTYPFSVADSLCPNQQTNRLCTELILERDVSTPSQISVMSLFRPYPTLKILFSTRHS
jgi:hypothetical protein